MPQLCQTVWHTCPGEYLQNAYTHTSVRRQERTFVPCRTHVGHPPTRVRTQLKTHPTSMPSVRASDSYVPKQGHANGIPYTTAHECIHLQPSLVGYTFPTTYRRVNHDMNFSTTHVGVVVTWCKRCALTSNMAWYPLPQCPDEAPQDDHQSGAFWELFHHMVVDGQQSSLMLLALGCNLASACAPPTDYYDTPATAWGASIYRTPSIRDRSTENRPWWRKWM